ncbi:MAG TPA: glycosyl hydrolase [Gemmatimonadaceae bacterium]|nr:glycosyl hydrolase [Gemmatimonadaceae bacterium]
MPVRSPMMVRPTVRRGVASVAAAVTLLLAGAPLAPGALSSGQPGVLRAQTVDSASLAALQWRELGPARGGRSVAVAGSTDRPLEYWMGTVGGGVWKTTDGGTEWQPMTDDYFGGTIGAIGVAESNPDIVYVGGGETHIRGNTSHGDGLWKTTDAGKTWTYMGLKETRHIARVRVHPTNPDIVYVGALGHAFGNNPERGVFKTTDGGKTWAKILFRNDSTGISDLVMDPNDPNTLYAAFWHAYRRPWMLNSGGPGGGIFKTTDGGETWREITGNKGLPRGVWGKIGLAVSPANSQRVWAIIEADSGGVYRSDDAGQTWEWINKDRSLRQRAWYYSKIFADPKDTNVVYGLNVSFFRSKDGGRTFEERITVPHGDNHDMWIAPNDPLRMIEGNDGGANVSFNGGKTWSAQDFATAQMYHVSTTNHFPYHVCGAQQDNSTLCGPSRGERGVDIGDWEDAGGGESGYVTAHPDKPDIIFAGSYGGLLTRKNMDNGLERNINAWPSNPMGHSSEDIKYRFQWTFPIVISQHDTDVLYVGGSQLFRSTNEGQSFDIISPPLARNDPKTMGPSGGPITKDQTGVETYGTIFTLAESPLSADVLWVGTDDGYVQLTRDGGKTWKNVTPKAIGDFARISIIDASRFNEGTAYVAANRFQLDDFTPSLWKTTDFGTTWTKIVNGIAADEFTRVIREDPERRGLLYAGTERGVWVSFNDGANWQRLQQNLPPVPVHDLAIKEGDLIAGTHGRSFWVMDDLSALRQMTPAVLSKSAHLFEPRDAYRIDWGGRRGGGSSEGSNPGANPTSGAVVFYHLANAGQKVKLEFVSPKGEVIKSFESAPPKAEGDTTEARGGRGARGPAGPGNKKGLNSFAWDMRYPDASTFNGMILWSGRTTGPVAPAGTYTVRMTVGDAAPQVASFDLLNDPRTTATAEDLVAQFEFLMKVRDKTSEANDAIKTIRNVKAQLEDRAERASRLKRSADALASKLGTVEQEVYQVKNQSNQDPLNFPIKLNNKIAALAGVAASGPYAPTDQTIAVFEELTALLKVQMDRLQVILDEDLKRFNEQARQAGLEPVVPKAEEPEEKKPVMTMDEEENDDHIMYTEGSAAA